MDSYSVLHGLSEAVFSAYTYYQIYVDSSSTLVYKGVTLTGPTTGSVVLNLTVSSIDQLAGSSGVFLLGKKNPEQYHRGPAGQNGLNTDGTWNIRG